MLIADNGREFAAHEQISAVLGCQVRLFDAYALYRWGCNKYYNRQLRHFFLKQKSFAEIQEQELRATTAAINLWSRKSLNWQRPIKSCLQSQCANLVNGSLGIHALNLGWIS